MTSHLSPADAKAAIRSHKKRWLDRKNGARGWIAGRFVCLWWNALQRHGPMLFGWIGEDGAGARIRGRAGSNLHGIAMLMLLSAGIVPLLWYIASSGQISLGGAVLLAMLEVACVALALWMASKERKDAEPLVRFLQKTVTKQGKLARMKQALPSALTGVALIVNGETQAGQLTARAIQDTLEALDPDDFAILERAPERYLQSLSTGAGWVLEKREGDSLRHFRAHRSDGSKTFDLDEILDAFLAYASEGAMPSFVTWQTVRA